MLIVGPNSTCDICAESFMEAPAGIPHTIPCGHIFCGPCFSQIQPQCPICRRQFFRSDIHPLHVDSDSTSMTPSPQADARAQRFFANVAAIADGRATAEETQRVSDQLRAYCNSRSDRSVHTPLGISYRLLLALTESRRRLEQGWHNEETVRRNEELLRRYCNGINGVWRSQVSRPTMPHERTIQVEIYQSLREEFDQLGNARSVVESCNTAIPHRTTPAARSSSQSRGRRVFRVIAAASLGCAVLLYAWFGGETDLGEGASLSSSSLSFGDLEYFEVLS